MAETDDLLIIQETSLIELADVMRDKFKWVDASVGYVSNRLAFNVDRLPEWLTMVRDYAFYNCSELSITSIPEGVTSIGYCAFQYCSNLNSLTFKGTPTTIDSYAFRACINLRNINVPWAEGAVSGAPWGAYSATINYDYVEGE